MEKYSAFRDPPTGIQPFLTPVPPLGSSSWTIPLKPLAWVFSLLRTLLVTVLGLLLLLIHGVCLLFVPVPVLHRSITWLFTAVIARLVLLIAGCLWISVEDVSIKRGRTARATENWKPKSGDIIISNWVSWIEILWLAFRFDPIFVLPICQDADPSLQPPSATAYSPSTTMRTRGQHKKDSAAASSSSPSRTPSGRRTVLGFRRVSLLSILRKTGHVPPYHDAATIESTPLSLQDLRSTADRPIVLFPECTTSNGRGILRFADVFSGDIMASRDLVVFIMCVRYEPPTLLAPTLAHSIPSRFLNPVPHLLSVTTSLTPSHVSIRLLATSESPRTAPTGSAPGTDGFTELCASLVAQIGKMKRTVMSWEDKAAFLEFYRKKR